MYDGDEVIYHYHDRLQVGTDIIDFPTALF